MSWKREGIFETRKETCKNCKDREPGCHDKCIKYTALLLFKLEDNKQKDKDSLWIDYCSRRAKRYPKPKGVSHKILKNIY